MCLFKLRKLFADIPEDLSLLGAEVVEALQQNKAVILELEPLMLG
jgi:hypothetical protein